jgi:simple sugar transport system ATP-binding protein
MALELKDIHKHFVQKRANDGITLRVEPGRIHGILGENGAGKSTLMKILSGFITRTSGEILMDGVAVEYDTPSGASARGIGMLYQDPLDFPPLTVLENFMAGRASALSYQKGRSRAELLELSRALGFTLSPDSPMRSLTVGERQQLELLRLLSLGTRVLILDEPTTGISAIQKDALFSALKTLASEGKSVVLVSHKLEDVEALCDEVTVLREGKVTGAMERPFETRRLLKMMFGAPPAAAARVGRTPVEEVLRIEGLSAPGGRTGLSGCSVTLRSGEVVGLAGLEGSGQDVFLRVACGLVKPLQGRIVLQGRDLTGLGYHAFRGAGVAFQPSARLEEGLIPGLTIAEHCAVQESRRSLVVQWKEARIAARRKIEKYRVVGGPDTTVDSLSGGNQQRLLLSFLPDEPQLLLLENPTRGLDLESVRRIWEMLDGYTSRGCTIVFSSSELDEILMVAGRVLVFFDGRIIKDERPDETDALELGRAIAGKV